ncbi:MAG: family 78 glycoside hydrolase catalytic domain, partial [Phycisphaerae bacterium]|nr:family 78 glycoside hydrolase catalytic domain [Phycisphaerae bacterium]
TRVQIRFAETLKPNGHIYRDNYRSARATDVYILKGEGEEVWEPRFTYRGFRYAELTGYPGAPVKNALTAVVAHSAAPFAGDFECSDELANRIHRNIVWGQRSNLHSVPTDCPQRDERLGWTGDAQLFGPTACYNMEMVGFFAKWMKDIVDSQEKDGAVPLICPPIGLFSPARGWSDAIVIIPWILYQFYGDRRIIEDNYDAMVAWVEYMRRKATGYLYDRPKRKRRAGAKPRIEHFTTAYFYYSTKLLSRMACAIGRNADGDKYAALSDKIVEALNREYFDPESNTYPGSTQEANILPLHLGIVPPGRREAVMDNVVKDIVSRKHHLRTHFIGTACLLPELTRMGHHDVAWRLAVQRTYPSWGYMIEKGATAIWELWNSDKMGPQMNSRNHFVYGSVGQWFFEALGGINRDPDFPGFKRIIIHPQAAGNLVWARARYESVHGLIRSA